ncbi:CoA-disulfide reductase [Chungangia koreensis]|uniref:CoA-disulfide reductase n=1 Tax=Chungangia koreensis TaxID=752657 RepID=A0ABV8X231_9LACT
MKIIVVGAVAGGATAASQIRRVLPDAEITVYDKGSTMSFGNCGMPYVIGGVIEDKKKIISATPESFKEKKNIEVYVHHEVVRIDRKQKLVEVKNVQTGKSFTDSYDKLILSPGGSARRPTYEGMDTADVFTLRSYDDMEEILSYIHEKKPSSCAVVGGGFIGVELAEVLHEQGISVSVIERNKHMMSILDPEIAVLLDEELRNNGVALHRETEIANINGSKLTLKNGDVVEADFVMMSVGIIANTELAEAAGLEIGETGGIVTNDVMQTTDPDIYAIGDAAENKEWFTGKPKRVPLAWHAHRQAYIVAKHLEGKPVRIKGLLGTSISKVFSQSVAMTGMTDDMLEEEGIPFKTVLHKSKTNAGYYPDHANITLKVTYHAETRKVLGAQAFGGKGIDKRIDVIATAIFGGLTVDDLAALELSYSPPYSSPKDPVNMVGYKAE